MHLVKSQKSESNPMNADRLKRHKVCEHCSNNSWQKAKNMSVFEDNSRAFGDQKCIEEKPVVVWVKAMPKGAHHERYKSGAVSLWASFIHIVL